jgi:hypothetical protein
MNKQTTFAVDDSVKLVHPRVAQSWCVPERFAKMNATGIVTGKSTSENAVLVKFDSSERDHELAWNVPISALRKRRLQK